MLLKQMEPIRQNAHDACRGFRTHFADMLAAAVLHDYGSGFLKNGEIQVDNGNRKRIPNPAYGDPAEFVHRLSYRMETGCSICSRCGDGKSNRYSHAETTSSRTVYLTSSSIGTMDMRYRQHSEAKARTAETNK